MKLSRLFVPHYTVQEGKAALMERFGLDDVQAQAIVQMPLGRLAGLEREKIQTEVDELRTKIAEYNAILADEQKIRAIVKEELLEIKEKFNDPRRTELATIEGEVDIEDLIPEESCGLPSPALDISNVSLWMFTKPSDVVEEVSAA